MAVSHDITASWRHYTMCNPQGAKAMTVPPRNHITAAPLMHTDLVPHPDQLEEAQFLRLHKRGATWSPPGKGKGGTPDTKVMTPFGWTTLGELSVGDVITGSDGLPITVTGVFARGELDVFRVTFQDGASVLCDADHLWTVSPPASNCYGVKRSWRVRTTAQLRARLTDNGGKRLHYIPMCEPIEFAYDDDFEIDPYLLGVILGDGHIAENGCVQFVQEHDSRVIDEAMKVLPVGTFIEPYEAQGNLRCSIKGTNHHDNPIARALVSYGLAFKKSYEKFVPEKFLYGSIQARLAVLQGLMDTDGEMGMNGVSQNAKFGTTSKRLAEAVRFIVQSVGGTATWRERVTNYTHNGELRHGRLSYTITMKMPNGYLPSRAKPYRELTKYTPYRVIDSILPEGRSQVICISVDAPDELYITDDCVVTHNTLVTALAAVAPVLISAPTYAAPKWRDWLNAHIEEAQGHVYLATGRYMDRYDRIEVLAQAASDPKGWTIVNHDMLRPELEQHEMAGKTFSSAVIKPDGEWLMEYPLPAVLSGIIDEAHWMRGRKAWRATGAAKLFSHTPYLYQATATPKYKDEDDYYQQLRILYPSTYTSFGSFQKMFLKTWNDGWKTHVMGLRDFDAFIKVLGNVVTRHDYLPGECPEPIELDPFYIDPSPETRRRLRQIKDEYRDGTKVFTSAGAVIAAFDQAAVCEEKLEALADWINDNAPRIDGTSRGVLVFCWQRATAQALKRYLEKHTGKFYTVITGEMSPEKRAQVAEQADNIIANWASMSEAIDCSHLPLVAAWEEYHTFGADYQGVGRSVRPRHAGPNHPYVKAHPELLNYYLSEPIIIARFVLKGSADEAKRLNVSARTSTAKPVLEAVLRS